MIGAFAKGSDVGPKFLPLPAFRFGQLVKRGLVANAGEVGVTLPLPHLSRDHSSALRLGLLDLLTGVFDLLSHRPGRCFAPIDSLSCHVLRFAGSVP